MRRLELVKLDRIRPLLEAMDRVVDDGTDAREPARAQLAMVRALADGKVESMRNQIAGLERPARALRQIVRGAEAGSKG